MNNPIYHVAITFIDGIGATNAKLLISYCGSPEAVFKESKRALLKIPGIGSKTVESIVAKSALLAAEKEMEFVKKNNLKVLLYNDTKYPRRLIHCVDAPLVLYQKGDTHLNPTRSIAIIGTRKATSYGKHFVADLLAACRPYSPQIISGMALGIDGCAHKQSLENGLETIGVLGHHLGFIYPSQHYKLSKDMLEMNGSLLTECNTQEPMVPGNFPRRNRVIAGMCDALIVVESDVKGGSIITANIANSYNKDVFALPGRVKDKYSKGCLNLIKTHKAHVITCAEDLIEAMGWQMENASIQNRQKSLLLNVSPDEQQIINMLTENEILAGDEMATATSKKISDMAVTLLEMELKGIIEALPGNTYTLR